MKEVRLYGELGRKFGKVHRLAVSTPAEAVHALKHIIKGFEAYMVHTENVRYRVFVDREERSIDTISIPTSSEVIKIIPVVAGAGGFFSAIAGAALMIAAPYIAPAFTSGALGFAASSLGMVGEAAIFSTGLNMMLGGVAQMLFTSVFTNGGSSDSGSRGGYEAANNQPSFAFRGSINNTAQGGCVPVCYGRMRVGSQVVSASLLSVNIPV